MSEPDSGSDAFAMRTKAVSTDGGFRINGTKTFISNGPVADVALTFAVTDSAKGYYGGITAFLVDSDTPGFRVGKPIEKMGLRTSLMSELVYDDVFVPESAVLGGVGGGASIFTHSMDWERVGIFASHVGTMERLLERSIQHARTRQQFGRPIGSYQAIAHRLADMKVQLEAARLLVYKAAWSLEHSRGAAMDASITKLFVSESLVKAALDAMQVFGGYGYMTEYGLERLLRDAVGSTVYSGTSEMQRTIIARWLGLQRSVE
jgi:alkylation response protein AidB-like acyl-CoA dehydrogenase